MADSLDDALFQENERLTARAGGRQYFDTGSLELRGGGHLESARIAYETWGELNKGASNAIVVCHALSGDSHAIGWWDRIVGPRKAIDTSQFFVVCTNVLGGCQGSTGPASHSPNGTPFGSSFPVISIEDMVEAQYRLIQSLGISEVLMVAGGSMGGMQALEWSRRPVRKIWATASCSAHSAMQIGFNETSRQAIVRDPNYRSGDYYDGPAPNHGLSVARMLGHLTYLSEASFASKFGRNLQPETQSDQFQVESYLNYQGDKFTSRFDANSFITLTNAIDRYEYPGFENSASEFLFTSFDSDWIYPSHQSAALNSAARTAGRASSHIEISLPWGHDSFLLDGEFQGKLVSEFLAG